MLLAIAVLPGCLTQLLWEEGGDREPTTRMEMVEERDESIIGQLSLLAGDAAPARIRWRSADGLQIQGALLGRPGEVVAALLQKPHDYGVHSVELESTRVLVRDELTEDATRLMLAVLIEPVDLAEVVGEAGLSQAARAALSQDSLVDFRLPTVCRDLVQQLPFADYAWLVGQAGDYLVAGQAFLDEHGEPVSFPSPDTKQRPAAASLATRMEFLSRWTLLLRLEGPVGDVLLRVKPDQLLLLLHLTAMQAVGAPTQRPGLTDPLARMLRVQFQQDAAHEEPDDSVAASEVQARYVRRQVWYAEAKTEPETVGFWAKLAFTPFTLAIDMTLGMCWQAIAKVLKLDDDDDEDTSGARAVGAPRARPRRRGESEADWRAREAGRTPRRRDGVRRSGNQPWR